MSGDLTVFFQANFLLVMVLVILVGAAFAGYRKGLVKMLVSILSLVVTLVLVIALQPIISGILKGTPFYENLKQETTLAIHDKVQEELEHSKLLEETEDFEGLVDELSVRLELPQKVQDFVKKGVEKINLKEIPFENAAETVSMQIGQKLADLVLDCGVFAVSYIIILIVVKMAFGALNVISYLPLIHGANKLAGFALGLVEGLCIVWVFFLLMTTFGGAELNETLFPQIQGNPLLLFLYENNLLMKLLMK